MLLVFNMRKYSKIYLSAQPAGNLFMYSFLQSEPTVLVNMTRTI